MNVVSFFNIFNNINENYKTILLNLGGGDISVVLDEGIYTLD